MTLLLTSDLHGNMRWFDWLIHASPWLPEGSWWARRGRTFVFNAGFNPDGDFPCHILLDIHRRTAFWRHPGGHECIQLDSFKTPFPHKHTN